MGPAVSPNASGTAGASLPAKLLDLLEAELALASATPAAPLAGGVASKPPRARRRHQEFGPQSYSTADYRAAIASMIQTRNSTFGISADGGAQPRTLNAALADSRPPSSGAFGHIPPGAPKRFEAAVSFAADTAGDRSAWGLEEAGLARRTQHVAIDVCPGAGRQTVAADGRLLAVANRVSAFDERLARLGTSAECRARWRAAAFARPDHAHDFDRFLHTVEGVAGSAIQADFALGAAFARLLDRTANGGSTALSSCAEHARDALRHEGDQVALGLSRILVTAVEQDIVQGAYDADLRGLDHALRGLYRTEALRVAVEKRFNDGTRAGPISAPGCKYQAQPLDIHLGLQRRLGPKLGLPGTWMAMVYPKLMGFTQADYDAVEQEVRTSEQRGFGVYLAAHSPHWRGVMARVDPEGFAAAQAARLALQEHRFAADVDAYCVAHPHASPAAACRAIGEAHAWRAFAPLMRKHLAPQGLWPLNRGAIQRWIYGLCYRLSARLEAGWSTWR